MTDFSRTIDVFEFNSNLGLREQRGEQPYVKYFPKWLEKHGLYKEIKKQNTIKLEPPTYEMRFDDISGVLNESTVLDYAIQQKNILKKELRNENFKLILGGDCSILLGNAAALKEHGNYGLFFLDGHTDYTNEQISHTKAVAGMDLAIVTGWGTEKLTNIENLGPYFTQSNVYCVGNKESDIQYVEPILHSDIHYFDLERTRSIGGSKISNSFLEEVVSKNKLDGFFIHFDVDVLSGQIMPAVDSLGDAGLNYTEIFEILLPLIKCKKCVGMEITIFDPSLDPDGKIIEPFIKFMSELFRD